MLSTVIQFFTGKYGKLLLIAVAIGCVYLYWNGRTKQIAQLTAKNIELATELQIQKAQCEANILSLRNQIESQNQHIQGMSILFQNVENTAKVAIASANSQNSLLNEQLALKIKQLQKITPKSCQEAIDVIVDVAKTTNWK